MSPTALRITAPLLATLPALAWAGAAPLPRAAVRTQRPNTWVKLSPVPGGPPSPQLGYEGACAWDGRHGVLIRYGGHNQGGGGEQHSELWTFDPLSGRWTLKEPNTSPPGVCCAQQNVFDPVHGRYLRFPSFSGSHGWQWWREIYLNDSSVWSYDLTTNRWRNLRPLPAPSPRPLRCAAWDSGARAAVLFGGEGSREGTLTYDPAENTWSWPKPASQPAFRSGGNMAYDASRRLHILFGSQFDDDRQTWIYDSTRTLWSAVRPPTQPPTAQNDAVLAYDPLRREALAVVKVTQGMGEQGRTHLESWAFDAGKLAWRKLSPDREPDPSGNRARVLVFAPELNAALLENRPHPPYGPAEQQVWSYRFEDGPVALPLPAPERSRVTEDLSVSVLSPRHVRLCWEPAGGDPAGYLVERAAVEVYTDDQLRRLKAQTPPLVQPMVGAITRIGPFRTLTPRLVPGRAWEDHSVRLNQPAPVSGEPTYERRFPPEQVDPSGKPYPFAVYAYRVRAVGKDGRLHGPSPAVLTIPASPEWVFSREVGSTCRVRWAPGQEAGLRGYRVYRMDGRFDREPIRRLTSEPLTATAWTDLTAGTPARRYYVVAVDALGQEGFPSSPVWCNREWKPFYTPFTGEWHQ